MPYKNKEDRNRRARERREERRPDEVERLLRYAIVDDETGCWRCRLPHNNKGYAWCKRDGRYVLAHRLSYELFIGPIPDGLEIDHVRARGCRYRDCINPAHLEAVTHAINSQRGDTGKATGARNRAKTKCPKGHLIDGVRKSGAHKGERYCKTCRQIYRRKRRAAA